MTGFDLSALVDRVLTDDTFISTRQRAAVIHDGDLFVNACPGAGKSRLIGLRMAWQPLHNRGARLAATSFTNTAVEVMHEAAATVGVTIGHPHFIGTLHDFLLSYVVYPFGYLILGCSGRPRIDTGYGRPEESVQVGESAAERIPLSAFTFDAGGNLIVASRALRTTRADAGEAIQRGGNTAMRLKQKMGQDGRISIGDCMHYARRILAERDGVRQVVAQRFTEIIVDEVQDTSEIQLECLRLLCEAEGGPRIVVAGDLDQAIYEFHRGSPDAVKGFVSQQNLASHTLDANFRCSQAIADSAHHLSSRSTPDLALGPTRQYPQRPEVYTYSSGSYQDVLETFESRLGDLKIDAAGARIVVRTRALARRINGHANPSQVGKRVRLLLNAAAELQSGKVLDPRAVRSVEGLLIEMAWGSDVHTETSAVTRDAASSLVFSLPALDTSLGVWLDEARERVAVALQSLTDTPRRAVGQWFRIKSTLRSKSALDIARVATPPTAWARTIHSVKGETHDAILLIEQTTEDDSRWWELNDGVPSEEGRIRFVAITRARKYVAIAIPDGAPMDLVRWLADSGFAPVVR